jgi:hypothetical protein
LPEPSAQAVVLDTDVASRSFKGLLPLWLAAQPAGQQSLLTFRIRVLYGFRSGW